MLDPVTINESIFKVNGRFEIPNYISENVILVQLMDAVGNVNHAASIVAYCIFDSNY